MPQALSFTLTGPIIVACQWNTAERGREREMKIKMLWVLAQM